MLWFEYDNRSEYFLQGTEIKKKNCLRIYVYMNLTHYLFRMLPFFHSLHVKLFDSLRVFSDIILTLAYHFQWLDQITQFQQLAAKKLLNLNTMSCLSFACFVVPLY